MSLTLKLVKHQKISNTQLLMIRKTITTLQSSCSNESVLLKQTILAEHWSMLTSKTVKVFCFFCDLSNTKSRKSKAILYFSVITALLPSVSRFMQDSIPSTRQSVQRSMKSSDNVFNMLFLRSCSSDTLLLRLLFQNPLEY